MVHGECRSGQAVCLHAVGGLVEDCGELLLLIGSECAEHEVDLMSLSEFSTHADAEPGIVGVAEFGRDILEAVVSAIGTALFQTHGTEGLR